MSDSTKQNHEIPLSASDDYALLRRVARCPPGEHVYFDELKGDLLAAFRRCLFVGDVNVIQGPAARRERLVLTVQGKSRYALWEIAALSDWLTPADLQRVREAFTGS